MSAELLDVDQPSAPAPAAAVPASLVAEQPEHHAQLVLGRPADRLDRFERGAGLLRALAHQAPAHPGLDGDHRQGVGDDVVQLAGDAHPLLPDPGGALASASRPARLVRRRAARPAAITAAAAALSPMNQAVRERQEALHGLDGTCASRPRGRVQQRPAQGRRDSHGGGSTAPGQARGGQVQRQPEQDAERQRGVAGGHDQPGRRGGRPRARQRPAPQKHDQAARHDRQREPLPPLPPPEAAAPARRCARPSWPARPAPCTRRGQWWPATGAQRRRGRAPAAAAAPDSQTRKDGNRRIRWAHQSRV